MLREEESQIVLRGSAEGVCSLWDTAEWRQTESELCPSKIIFCSCESWLSEMLTEIQIDLGRAVSGCVPRLRRRRLLAVV